MFVQLNEKIDSIKLILFYDAVHKFNYENELNKVMAELFNTVEDKKLLEMFEFQCIYIKSSYLAGEYFDAKREINKLNYKNDKLESELEAKTNKIDKLEYLVSELKDEINLLRNEITKLKGQNQGEGGDISNLSEQKDDTIEKADKKDDNNEKNQ